MKPCSVFTRSVCICLRTAALLVLAIAAQPPLLEAEEWVPYAHSSLELPGTSTVKGFSEAYYDRDSILRSGSGRFQIRLKEITFLGDLTPTNHFELLMIDCAANGFELRVEMPGSAGVPADPVNTGTIGAESPYRSIREAFCAY